MANINRESDLAITELLEETPDLKKAVDATRGEYLVASELIRARRELGISQAELARRMGTNQSVISRIEQMDTSPTARTLNAIAHALGRQLEIRFADPEAVGKKEVVKTAESRLPLWSPADPAAVEATVELIAEAVKQVTKQVKKLQRAARTRAAGGRATRSTAATRAKAIRTATKSRTVTRSASTDARRKTAVL